MRTNGSNVSVVNCPVVTMHWLTLLFIVKLCHPCLTSGGWCWDKYRQDFISIMSIPTYAQVYEEAQMKIREKSHQKLHGQVIRVGYYSVKQVIEFVDNNTKITGAFGEVWNTLSEYLNFTIQPVVFTSRLYHVKLDNGTRKGVIPVLSEGKVIDAIPRMNCDYESSSLVDCTIPIFRTNIRLYAKPIISSDNLWLFKMFRLSTGFAIMVVMFISIVIGCIATKIYNQTNSNKIHLTLSDRMFYTFTGIFSQGWEPSQLEQTSKILVISIRIFGWFLIYGIGSIILALLTHTEFSAPFKNLETLYKNTKYQIWRFNGSLASTQLPMKYINRSVTFTSRHNMFQTICSSNRQYAAMEVQDSKEYTKIPCQISAIGESIMTLWITSGIVKGFPYMQSINMGILKMHESGLLTALVNRYKILSAGDRVLISEAIDLNHVYIMHAVLALGIFIAIILFICEHIVFWHQQNQKCKIKRMYKRKRV